MAAVADKVVVELELRDGQYLSRVRQNERVFSQAQQRIGDSAENAERRIRASSDGIARSFRNIATALAATVSVAAIKGLADSYIQLQNRLRVTGLEGEALANMYERLNDLANETRTETEATIQVYARLRLASEGIGFTNEEIIRTTDILNKALQASGATTQEATAALLQFSQAIGSGILAGDELRSIRENAPLVARAIAAEFNTTIGGLKVLGEQGLLTSDRVLAGVLAAGAEVDALFARTEATVGNALTRLGNELLKYIGETDEALGVSERFVAALNAMANNIDRIIPVITALVTLFGVRLVAAGTAAAASEIRKAYAFQRAGGAAVQQRLALDGLIATQGRLMTQNEILAARMAFTAGQAGRLTTGARALGSGLLALAGGPVGLATTAVAALAAGIVYLIQQNTDAAISARALQEAEERAAPAKTQLEKLTRELATASRDRAAAIREEINELINLQRVEAARAREAYNQAKQQARARESGGFARGSLAGDPRFAAAYTARQLDELSQAVSETQAVLYEGLDIGAAPDTRAVREARAEYKATLSVVTAMEEALQEAESAQRSLNAAATDDRGAAKRAREALQRARMLEDLQAETEMEEARAAEDEARIRQLEREAEIRNRLRSLIDAGFSESQASEISGRIQARLDSAREQSLQRQNELLADSINLRVAEIDEDSEIIRMLQRQNELRELQIEFGKVLASQEDARSAAISAQAELEAARVRAAERYLGISRAEHAIRVAEASGNERLLRQLRDAEEIRRRTLEYQRQGRLTEDEARSRAASEVTREREATTYGEQRELFSRAFSDGIRAALEGDVGGFVTSQIGSFADRALERLGEQIYDQIFGGVDAVAQGTAQGTAQGAAVSVAMTAAATSSGAIIASAMVTAGASVAGAISAAIATSSGAGNVGRLISSLPFGGFRSRGGPVRAGFAYDVGESGRERFIAPANGFISPNPNAAGASSKPVMVKLIVDESSMFAVRVQEISGPIAVQAATTAYSRAADDIPRAQINRSRQRLG